ncbi:hypothetical protein NSK_008509 [Nannochloropsis salina CCMP1776]|uniref:Uncharacterized protein n=1 Tax=Nannochloropsis salina CCMP1776 TaxID=1027361 RepID=A0A4D9CLH7_9STRA|nr:hypothetical protein NSK_008509 [Nannochloropsis salina CCMP1776]|eukprot:TFJ79951.1 hypothetical protein NSK_008509 [Nannochloropsis salina CCMP1776]
MGELSPTAVARLTPEEMLTKTARDEQHEKEARAYDLLRLDRNLAPQVEEELAAREQSGVVCSVCGSEKVALVHRYNALEDEQQRKVEMACNACGAAVVQIG